MLGLLSRLGTSTPATLSTVVLAGALACSSSGGAGQKCVYMGGLLNGGYSCSGGLVCNEGRSPPICEQLNTNGVGGPCGSDANCKTTLFCDIKTCANLIAAGDPCPTGFGCQPGLMCEKPGGQAVCVPVAGAGDDGGSMGDGSWSEGGGPCGWRDDAGEHIGSCAQGAQCCPGGAINTFYCNSGDGPCPAVP